MRAGGIDYRSESPTISAGKPGKRVSGIRDTVGRNAVSGKTEGSKEERSYMTENPIFS